MARGTGRATRGPSMPRWLPNHFHVPTMESFHGPVEGLMVVCRWFIRMRWLAVVSLFVIVAVTRWGVGIQLHLRELFGLGVALAIYNLLFYWYLETLSVRPLAEVEYRVAERFAQVQVVADLVCMTVLLHFSGGVDNPLSTFYVFHVIIASIMLPKGQSYAMAALAFSLFTLVVVLEYVGVLPHYYLEQYLTDSGGRPAPQFQNWRFIFGHLGVLAVTLTMSAFFATQIVARLRERQEELMVTSARLAALEERKSRFMRVAAHQLRSPLSAIKSLLSVVLGSYEAVDEARRLDLIRRAENRTGLMLELLADLLSLSRLRDARQDEAPARDLVVVDEVVRKVIALYQPQSEAKRQAFDARLASDSAQVVGDADRLRDVFTNLVSNAVKYTPEGGRVTVHTTIDDHSRVVCEVADTGIGIPEEDQKHLFEEFFRAGNAREFAQEGTGLGLSIVREIVEAHGGSIACESAQGQGTRFTVTLPLAACALPRKRKDA